ncbi:hypothetical protein ES707_18760 [subsurface metagenome]
MRQKSDDIALVEGSNDLNVQLTPYVAPRATLSLSGGPLEPEYERGEKAFTYLEIINTGSVTATGVECKIIIYDSNGNIWFETGWTLLQDISPGYMFRPGFLSTLVDTDPLGQYTYEAWARAENADEVSDAGNTFRAVYVAPPLPFTFSDVRVQRLRCQSATAWNTLDFWCTITNQTDRSITHTLTPYYRVETKYGYGDPLPCAKCAFTLTLEPGEDYNCNIEGNYYDVEDRKWRCATLLGFSAGVPYGGCAFLRDENGNDSPQACV